jgi:hypothetical protein
MRRMPPALDRVVPIEIVLMVTLVVISYSLRCLTLLGLEGNNARGHRRDVAWRL